MADFHQAAQQMNGHGQIASSYNGAVAIRYAKAGIPVFPCYAQGERAKQPHVKGGHHAATADLDMIRQWWAKWPEALVGIPAGPPSGVWVLDVDGEAGRLSLEDLLARLKLGSVADLTPCVTRTPSGGLHFIFKWREGEHPRNRAGDIGEGLDTRALRVDGESGGFFIAAGSALPDGRAYEAINPADLAPMGGEA
jgi:hypothetical protein